MVQFLSINFFSYFFNFCWVFQKFPFFCVTLYISLPVKYLLFLPHIMKLEFSQQIFFFKNTQI